MSKDVKQLQGLMVESLKRRGYYPKDEMKVLLKLGEEVGELYEAVREKQTKVELSHEVVDVFWCLLVICDLRGIDLETAFMEKLRINEERTTRPSPI